MPEALFVRTTTSSATRQQKSQGGSKELRTALHSSQIATPCLMATRRGSA
jgi:hypothetical protein